MTVQSRLLADAAALAADVFDEEAELGPYRTATDGTRYHSVQRGDDFVITIVSPDGSRLVCEYVGIDGSKV